MGKQLFNLKGMMRDLDASKGSNQYAYEIRNLRLTAQEDSTLLALTTEKGNIQFTLKDETGNKPFNIRGKIVGYCTVGTKYIVLFTHASSPYGDSIYRLEETVNNIMLCKELYGSSSNLGAAKDLGFTDNTVIEAIGVYENEDIQKAYWIDGVNQPRVINIVADATTIASWDNNDICPFDFMLKMKLEEDVTITKRPNTYGMFPAGTIQYVLSYHTKLGQQTPSFYVSSIYYVSPASKGASAEDTVNTAFELYIDNIDQNFDYIDVYSVQRTSENGTPICKKVTELKITGNNTTYVDNGINTETVDYSDILYLGGTNIVPYTMEQKNNVLFFGNIKYNTSYITDAVKNSIFNDTTVSFVGSEDSISKGADGSYYMYETQLNLSQAEISTFMSDESYYIGIILQDEYGVWSDVIPVGGSGGHGQYVRHINNQRILDITSRYFPVNVQITFGNTAKEIIANYKRLKIVRLKENPSVLCQGAVAPTVYNKKRKEGIYAQSSWFFRPINTSDDIDGNAKNLPEWRHNHNIKNYYSKNPQYFKGEITGAADGNIIIDAPESWNNDFSDNEFFIDWNLITLHSPDIEFGNIQDGDYDVSIIGDMAVDKSVSYAYLTLANPTRSGRGLFKNEEDKNSLPGESLLTPLWFEDNLWYLTEDSHEATWGGIVKYPLFTWSRNILTTQRSTTSGLKYSSIDTKCLSSLRTATKNIYKASGIPISTSRIHIYQEDEQPIIIDRDANNPDYMNSVVYQGAVNNILTPYGYTTYGIGTSANKNTSDDYIQMKYKSSKHAVMQLLYKTNGNLEDHKQTIMPNTLDTNDVYYQKLFWSKRNLSPQIPNWFSSGSKALYVKPSTFSTLTLIKDNTAYIGLAIKKEEVHRFSELEGSYVYVDSDHLLRTRKNGNETITPIRSFLWTCVNSLSDWSVWLEQAGEYNKDLYYLLRPVQDFRSKVIEYKENTFKKLGPDGVIDEIRIGLDNWDDAGDYYTFDVIDTVTKDSSVFALYESATSQAYSTNNDNYIYLVNLKTEQQPLQTFDNTSWITASLSSKINSNVSDYIGTIGDAYYQRFDCLKTYPYSTEDVNQVVEILSFMCETRINIDGRYDTKRGLIDNTIVTGENFNLLNMGYTQEDNVFSASYLDAETFNIDTFPNQIMWTKQKVYGAYIDNWTHAVATSTLDMDGNKGKVTSLKLWNDKLLCLQDNGLALIKYNENVAISSTTGTPIELANSNKVEGKSYISNSIGCSNKESIQVTPDGLYFADSNTKEIYKYKEGLQSLSKAKGFNTYFYDSNVKFDKIKTFYDAKLKDVYFQITKNIQSSISINRDIPTPPVITTFTECLIYNEQFGEFTSFMDYNMDFLFSVKDSLIAIKNNVLWKQFEGDYLNLFGINTEYSIDLLCSENPIMDKTFTNIEFRADVFDGNTLVNTGSTLTTANALPFTHIKAWNEYQTTADTAFTLGIGSGNLSQKFRIWRGDIPRTSNNFLERIRNTWTRVKLWKTADNNHYKTVIHDIVVSYI